MPRAREDVNGREGQAQGRALAPSWLLLGVVLVLLIGAADVVLLEVGKGYFRTGYNSPHLASWLDRGLFAAFSLLLDATLVLGLWCLACPLLRRTRLGGLQQMVVAAGFAGGVPLVLDVLSYRLHQVLGDVLDFGVLWQLAGADLSGALAEMLSQAPGTAALGLGALALLALVLGLAGGAERFGLRLPGAPRGRDLLRAFLVLLLPVGLLLAVVTIHSPRLAFGLVRKPSGLMLHGLIEQLTDVDRDGAGLLARPGDPDLLDPALHPWALDRPGNGIDENGFAGDHPRDFELPERPPVPPPGAGGPRPPLLFVFLESFRGDLLEARFEGRRVTPFLARLADEGAATAHAYAHTPFTGTAREQLFSGSLTYQPGEATLYDDFRARGYRVAHFSAQDDTHADAVSRLRLEEADPFYDARQDTERRTSRSTASVSLQVSWKTLVPRVEAFLETHRGPEPLLLYVNVVDTHFPYHHDELDPLLATPPLDRSQIHTGNAAGVRAAYLNAAANVDRAIERLAGAWWQHMGDDAPILVTGDHGQSFYEHGMLGHGQSLRAEQTRVPFILWGVGGRWPEPLGLADVRPRLIRSLFETAPGADDERPRARFVPDPGREIFLFLPRLDRPRLLGLRRLAGLDVLGLRQLQLRRIGPDGREERAGDAALARRMLLTWEALRLRAAGSEAAGLRAGREPRSGARTTTRHAGAE